jgi:protein NRD1
VSGAAPDGTFAAGVFRITNLLPPLMNDILQHAPPEENKVRLSILQNRHEKEPG